MELISRIKEIRFFKKMTQAELSERSGVTIGQISFIENNKTFPTAYTLWRLAEALDCKVDDLYKKQ